MPKTVITVTHPDGKKKVIVSEKTNTKPIKTREINTENKEEETRRAKPPIIKAGLTKERNPYKYGGKTKCK